MERLTDKQVIICIENIPWRIYTWCRMKNTKFQWAGICHILYRECRSKAGSKCRVCLSGIYGKWCLSVNPWWSIRYALYERCISVRGAGTGILPKELNVACCKGFLYWWGAATDFPSDNVHGIKMSDGCGAASFKRLQSISAERLPISWRGNLMVASDGLV